jgi:hypothetical protein
MTAIILTTNSGYPRQVSEDFTTNLRKVGYDQEIRFFEVSNDPIPLCTMRLFDYLAFLRQNPGRYQTVILSDLRDVLFQDNPLKIPHGTLDCFLEWEEMTIAKCPFNSVWIKLGFGEEEFALIQNKPISCAGFTIGTQAWIENYLDMVIECVAVRKQLFAGADQGIHNWLIHTGNLPCNLHVNEDSPVYTVGYVPGIFVRNHVVYNRKGIAPIVVHQFDRHVTAC